jgi:hypothetical protein
MFFDNLIHPKPPLYQKQTTNKKVRKFMITIKNYDSHLPISNYHLGDTHIFRIHNPNMKRLNKIKKNDFEPYINILNDTINTNKNLFENNNHYLNYTNSIGIIVDTYKSTEPNKFDFITVIFKNETNDYILNKYVVNTNIISNV